MRVDVGVAVAVFVIVLLVLYGGPVFFWAGTAGADLTIP